MLLKWKKVDAKTSNDLKINPRKVIVSRTRENKFCLQGQIEFLKVIFISWALASEQRFPSPSIIPSSKSLARIFLFLLPSLSLSICSSNSCSRFSISFSIWLIRSCYSDHSFIIFIIFFFVLHSSLLLVFNIKWERPFEAKQISYIK